MYFSQLELVPHKDEWLILIVSLSGTRPTEETASGRVYEGIFFFNPTFIFNSPVKDYFGAG